MLPRVGSSSASHYASTSARQQPAEAFDIAELENLTLSGHELPDGATRQLLGCLDDAQQPLDRRALAAEILARALNDDGSHQFRGLEQDSDFFWRFAIELSMEMPFGASRNDVLARRLRGMLDAQKSGDTFTIGADTYARTRLEDHCHNLRVGEVQRIEVQHSKVDAAYSDNYEEVLRAPRIASVYAKSVRSFANPMLEARMLATLGDRPLPTFAAASSEIESSLAQPPMPGDQEKRALARQGLKSAGQHDETRRVLQILWGYLRQTEPRLQSNLLTSLHSQLADIGRTHVCATGITARLLQTPQCIDPDMNPFTDQINPTHLLSEVANFAARHRSESPNQAAIRENLECLTEKYFLSDPEEINELSFQCFREAARQEFVVLRGLDPAIVMELIDKDYRPGFETEDLPDDPLMLPLQRAVLNSDSAAVHRLIEEQVTAHAANARRQNSEQEAIIATVLFQNDNLRVQVEQQTQSNVDLRAALTRKQSQVDGLRQQIIDLENRLQAGTSGAPAPIRMTRPGMEAALEAWIATEQRHGNQANAETARRLILEHFDAPPPYLPSLSLSRLGLKSLPACIGQLTALTSLKCDRNQLTSLPPEIGLLTALKKLNCDYNQLTSLPPEIRSLTALTILSFWGNRLTILPPAICLMTGLTELCCGSNLLTSLPPAIGQLSALRTLSLKKNPLRSLPDEFLNLKHLNPNESLLDQSQIDEMQASDAVKNFLYEQVSRTGKRPRLG
ncbi:MAG: leucine-rich repeat domain-containing protein [Burkholderiaceae bacterium]